MKKKRFKLGQTKSAQGKARTQGITVANRKNKLCFLFIWTRVVAS
jgi:hypothetical protein